LQQAQSTGRPTVCSGLLLSSFLYFYLLLLLLVDDRRNGSHVRGKAGEENITKKHTYFANVLCSFVYIYRCK
jgi:hypothetical protein